MGDLGRRAYDPPNGLVVRRGIWSFEAHGRTAITVLCTALTVAVVIYEARDIERQIHISIAEHESTYQRSVESMRAMIEAFDKARKSEHIAMDRRLDIIACGALMTESERKWAREQRGVTWDNRCPWITPEPK